jgi:hypothetical protein
MADARSTPDKIRARFDHDVKRFSNLDTGQAATVDSPLVLDLVTARGGRGHAGRAGVVDMRAAARRSVGIAHLVTHRVGRREAVHQPSKVQPSR